MEELKIIESALNAANLRGVFSLQDSVNIYTALTRINSKLNPPKEQE